MLWIVSLRSSMTRLGSLPRIGGSRRCALRSSLFDVLLEDDISLVVLHDVVAVKAVAVGVEIIFAFGARKLLGGEDRLANFSGSVDLPS